MSTIVKGMQELIYQGFTFNMECKLKSSNNWLLGSITFAWSNLKEAKRNGTREINRFPVTISFPGQGE